MWPALGQPKPELGAGPQAADGHSGGLSRRPGRVVPGRLTVTVLGCQG
jgi:hypothetical protein